MINLIFFLISFLACTIGAICGIGGGVIVKPVLDAFAALSVTTISFLSGCTVLAMTFYSVAMSTYRKESVIDLRISTPLAIGAVVGGSLGKIFFNLIASLLNNQNSLGAVQEILLFFLTFATMIYTLNMDKIKTYETTNIYGCSAIGLLLGILSSFLGIGGGPINLVVLYFFFSMSTKVAAQNSLYIILFSQFSSVFQSIVTKTVPEFALPLFAGMVACGIFGGIVGRKINYRIDDKAVNKLFIMVMVVIMFINIYNTYQYIWQ
jgi:uncharacterized membrane protein YfcA